MRISAGLRRGDGIYKEQTCCPKDAQCFPSWHHVKAAIGVCTSTYSTALGSISTTHPLSSGPPRALSLLSSATGTKNKIRVSLPRVLIRSVLVVSWHRAMWFMQTRETSWPEARAAFRTVVCRSNTQLRQQVPIPVQPWRALCPSPEQHEKPSKFLSRIQLHGVANPSHTYEAVRQYARFQLSLPAPQYGGPNKEPALVLSLKRKRSRFGNSMFQLRYISHSPTNTPATAR
ncbi:hypothetical protein V8C40DRAFT_247260 [Trichoderma camerunense]